MIFCYSVESPDYYYGRHKEEDEDNLEQLVDYLENVFIHLQNCPSIKRFQFEQALSIAKENSNYFGDLL